MLQIIGKGGLAREVAAYITGDTTQRKVQMYEYECEGIMPDTDTVIAIGSGLVRRDIANKFSHLRYRAQLCGYAFGDCKIGEGSVICPGTVLTVDINMGVHCFINLNCTIGHDTIIGNFTTLHPGVNVSGNCKIGELVTIGSNAVLRDGITICDNVTIGAGAVVVKDISEAGVYVGSPAKKIA